MKKFVMSERADLATKAETAGFTFSSMHGELYWDETSAYEFTLAEVEDGIEAPATELHALCREAISRITASEELMSRMSIPREHWDLVANSWIEGEPELYGRFDFIFDGNGPAKMLEYNADTPTSLYEAASFQWQWLEDQIAAGILRRSDDQFNRMHEALVERFSVIFSPNTDVHFAAVEGIAEDYATVETIAWAAREAGLGAHYTDIGRIALSTEGQFLDSESRVMGALFKLYPWEDLLRDEFAAHIVGSGCRFIEPAWKALLSNKAILPMLWQMFEGHQNLLPAFFETDVAGAMRGDSLSPSGLFDRSRDVLAKGYVTKPVFSREGASISIVESGKEFEASNDRSYDEHPRIVQAYHPLPAFDGFHPIIGAWIVGESCVGMGLREDRSRITQDLSRFKPHYIRD